MDNATFDIGDDGDDRTLMEEDDDDGANPAALDTIMARDDTINNFILFVLFILFVFVYIYLEMMMMMMCAATQQKLFDSIQRESERESK